MSIKHVYEDDSEPEINLTVDRNFETGTVIVTVRRYDEEKSISLDFTSLSDLMRHVGIGGTDG